MIPFIQNSRKYEIISIVIESRSLIAWGYGGERIGKIIFRSDEYIHYLNCGDNLTGVYICQTLSNCTL